VGLQDSSKLNISFCSAFGLFVSCWRWSSCSAASRCKINHGRHFGVVWTAALWQTAAADGATMHVMQIMKLLCSAAPNRLTFSSAYAWYYWKWSGN